MVKWIKLGKHEEEGEIWYSLPSKISKLQIPQDTIIHCKFSDGSIKRLSVEFPYNISKTIIQNGTPFVINLKAPCVMDNDGQYIQLGDIEVDEDEIVKI